jgi:hypothetical protein
MPWICLNTSPAGGLSPVGELGPEIIINVSAPMDAEQARETGRQAAAAFAQTETAVAPPAPETRQSPATRRKKG